MAGRRKKSNHGESTTQRHDKEWRAGDGDSVRVAREQNRTEQNRQTRANQIQFKDHPLSHKKPSFISTPAIFSPPPFPLLSSVPHIHRPSSRLPLSGRNWLILSIRWVFQGNVELAEIGKQMQTKFTVWMDFVGFPRPPPVNCDRGRCKQSIRN